MVNLSVSCFRTLSRRIGQNRRTLKSSERNSSLFHYDGSKVASTSWLLCSTAAFFLLRKLSISLLCYFFFFFLSSFVRHISLCFSRLFSIYNMNTGHDAWDTREWMEGKVGTLLLNVKSIPLYIYRVLNGCRCAFFSLLWCFNTAESRNGVWSLGANCQSNQYFIWRELLQVMLDVQPRAHAKS